MMGSRYGGGPNPTPNPNPIADSNPARVYMTWPRLYETSDIAPRDTHYPRMHVREITSGRA